MATRRDYHDPVPTTEAESDSPSSDSSNLGTIVAIAVPISGFVLVSFMIAGGLIWRKRRNDEIKAHRIKIDHEEEEKRRIREQEERKRQQELEMIERKRDKTSTINSHKLEFKQSDLIGEGMFGYCLLLLSITIITLLLLIRLYPYSAYLGAFGKVYLGYYDGVVVVCIIPHIFIDLDLFKKRISIEPRVRFYN